jgi:hypothetical protein
MPVYVVARGAGEGSAEQMRTETTAGCVAYIREAGVGDPVLRIHTSASSRP